VKNAHDKAVKIHDFNKIGAKVENLYEKAQKLKNIKTKWQI
jgi:hypothetical protein